MIDFAKEEKEFKSLLVKFEEEMKKVRTGRATPALLEGIMIESYGGVSTPLMHLATLSSPDPRSVLIQPWDKSNLMAIEKALERANLGVSIISETDKVWAKFPQLTEERRLEFVKLIKKLAEEGRISVRRRRDEIW